MGRLESNKKEKVVKVKGVKKFLGSHNMLLFGCLLLLAYLGVLYRSVEESKEEWGQIMEYYSRVQAAFMDLNQVGQIFMQ